MNVEMGLGAAYLGNDTCRFTVWAPRILRVELVLQSPRHQTIPLQRLPHGYHEATVTGVPPGSLYLYRLDGQRQRPDPASRFQPQGVHGPSQVVEPAFPWQDQDWTGGPALQDLVIYELHSGTFTPQGTLDAIIPHLEELKDLGVNALELMPLAQCPGNRNWGYDGVNLFAVQNNYGGPWALKRLVDACHQRGLSVLLDVVYNHLGPEGNYLGEFAPYFTEQYRNPWGPSFNFDGRHSDEVRRFFLANALFWLEECHLDGLRLDAIDYIKDFSARPFLQELAEQTRAVASRLGRRFLLIGESDRNDVRVFRSVEQGGLGLDAQWSDDFHNSLHALLTGEKAGYYQDFGRTEQLARALADGFVYTGEYSASRGRRHGGPTRGESGYRLVVCCQNHDQVGNRPGGDRLSQLISFEAQKLAAATLLLSPFVPLLFMGEEYGEPAPFPFFVNFGHPGMLDGVRRGRQTEFNTHGWRGEMLDPADERTFTRARLRHELKHQGPHRILWEFHRQLLQMRRHLAERGLLAIDRQRVTCRDEQRLLAWHRWGADEEVLFVCNYGIYPSSMTVEVPAGDWIKTLDSAQPRWQGPGSPLPDVATSDGRLILRVPPQSAVVYGKVRGV